MTVWTPFHFFVGSWQGSGNGKPGLSQVERAYEFVLNDQFLHVRSTSLYPPQEKNPKGEKHEEWGLVSYDRARSSFVLRQFHIEGFMNQYVLEEISEDGQCITFVTESIENIPAGWRAKETYRILDADTFVETFELAAPGKAFELYSESRLTRLV
jgi:hypothetical protein